MSNEETARTNAIKNIAGAQSFFCITVNNGNLELSSCASLNTLGTMLLALSRANADLANAINYAALAYAHEKVLQSIKTAEK